MVLTRKQLKLWNLLLKIARTIDQPAFEFDPIFFGCENKTLHILRDYGMIEIDCYLDHYIVTLTKE